MHEKILVVEDEASIADFLQVNLSKEGFSVVWARDGVEAVELFGQHSPDLVLLDMMLPGLTGLDVLKRIRHHSEAPVLVVSVRDDEVDKVCALEMGADDYVTKPFSVRELMLRVRAILRRAGGTTEEPSRLQHGGLEVDIASHRVWVQGEEVRLTALEFRLLATLLSRAGRVQTRDTLLADVWGMHAGLTTRTVDTHVTRLRKKLGDEAGNYIETLRGVGYRFRDSDDDSDEVPDLAEAL
ncbi:MAG: response regulator transcription factor [Myxococcales bacterium]|nr:response regulator transcription factor [Myxococcales bacterium]